MKTLEVLEKYLRGKRLAENTKRITRRAMTLLAEYSEEYPEKAVVINEFINGLKTGDTTAKLYFTRLNVVGEYMRKFYGITNPVEMAEMPDVKGRKKITRTPDEIRRMLASCRYGYDLELVTTFFETTARTSELSILKGKNIGFDTIRIMGKKHEVEYTLTPKLCERLKELAGGDDNFVFPNAKGEQSSVPSLSKRIKRICKRAGISGKSLGGHALRHAGATMIARYTGNVFAVKAKLQHDSIKSSQGYIDESVEDELKHSISPMAILEKTPWTGNREVAKQLVLEDGKKDNRETSLMVVKTDVKMIDDDYSEDIFPAIRGDIKIRPLLDTDDLNVIRAGFLLLARDEKYNLKMLKARELMKRILRKTGGLQ
jgi:integrase